MKTSSHAESVFTILFIISSLCNPLYVYGYSYLLYHLKNLTYEVHIPSHKLRSSYTLRNIIRTYVTGQLFVTINELVNSLMLGR